MALRENLPSLKPRAFANLQLLAFSSVFGSAVAIGHSYLGGLSEGAAVATGAAFGMAFWSGRPLGSRLGHLVASAATVAP